MGFTPFPRTVQLRVWTSPGRRTGRPKKSRYGLNGSAQHEIQCIDRFINDHRHEHRIATMLSRAAGLP